MPLRTDSLLFLPAAGVSFLAVPNSSNPLPVSGFYAGLATVSPRGLRVGVTLHWLQETGWSEPWTGKPIGLVEIGLLRL